MSIDWLKFCEPKEEGARYELDQPWVVDGWKCATDGRILVRERYADSKAFDTPTTGRAIPKLDRVIEPMLALTPDRFSVPFPPHDGALEESCAFCGGSGKTEVECKACDGTGSKEEGVTCPTCKGLIMVAGPDPCRWCCGLGQQLKHVTLAGRLLSGRYVKLIHDALPNPRYSLHGRPKEALYFVFGETGQGVLMPRNY